MSDDFFSNLQAATSNLDDIVFNRFATVVEINNDGTVNCREDEDDGLTHNNVPNPTSNVEVGDKVVLGFIDNSIYNPVILTGGEEAYTKGELDGFVDCLINRLDTGGDDGGGDVVGFDVDIDMRFTGVSGRDDSITLSANLIYVEE